MYTYTNGCCVHLHEHLPHPEFALCCKSKAPCAHVESPHFCRLGFSRCRGGSAEGALSAQGCRRSLSVRALVHTHTHALMYTRVHMDGASSKKESAPQVTFTRACQKSKVSFMTSEWGGLWRDNALDSVCCTKLDVLPSSLNRCGDKSWAKKTKKKKTKQKKDAQLIFALNFCNWNFQKSSCHPPADWRWCRWRYAMRFKKTTTNKQQNTIYWGLCELSLRHAPLLRMFWWTFGALERLTQLPRLCRTERKRVAADFKAACAEKKQCVCVCLRLRGNECQWRDLRSGWCVGEG